MPEWLEELFDGIDAAFFSGDSFSDEENMKRAEEYMRRWSAEIASNRKALEADSNETD